MKIRFPSYCKAFKCIAERCKNSCCIGWEIGVDKKTLEKYKKMPACELDILSHIDEEECATIRLSESERCPFLDDRGLCRIISAYGEEYVSDICRRHPRYFRRVLDTVEGGVGMVCEEACRLILSSDGFAEFYFDEYDICEIPEETEYDALSERKRVFELLCKEKLTYKEKIRMIEELYRLPEVKKQGEFFVDSFSELELISEDRRDLFEIGGDEEREEVLLYLTRFLGYLVYRHASIASDFEDFRARMGFCILLTSVLENRTSKLPEISFEEVAHIARMISEEVEYSEENTAALIFEVECLVC